MTICQMKQRTVFLELNFNKRNLNKAIEIISDHKFRSRVEENMPVVESILQSSGSLRLFASKI